MSSFLLRIAAWGRCQLLFVRYRWTQGGLTVRALRHLAQKKVVPQTMEEERVLAALSPRISLDLGQVASDARLAPGVVQGVLNRYAQDGAVKVEGDTLGYERYRLNEQIDVAQAR
jgi:hypothetical protein